MWLHQFILYDIIQVVDSLGMVITETIALSLGQGYRDFLFKWYNHSIKTKYKSAI